MLTQRVLQLILGRYSWALALLFITIGSFFAAKIINVFVYRSLRELPTLDAAPSRRMPAPPPQAGATTATSVKAILDRNLMAARREDMNPKPADAPKPEDSNRVVPCTIAAQVVGIIAAERSDWSYVVFRDTRTQDTGVYSPREGRNKLPNDITLLEVRPGEARFRKDGHIEQCVIWSDMTRPPDTTVAAVTESQETPPANGGDVGGISKVNENEYAIEQKKIQWVQEHLNEVATDARIVPAFRDGKSQGFKLFSIRPGSVYQQIGLQNGDVIEKINGYEMNSPDKALEIYGKLRDARSIQVQIERRGTPKSLTYQIR